MFSQKLLPGHLKIERVSFIIELVILITEQYNQGGNVLALLVET
jgi:hypothetical protein